MTDKERFEALINLLAININLIQSGILTSTEGHAEVRKILDSVKNLMGLN